MTAETVEDTRTGLTWQRQAGAAVTWSAANNACSSLALDGGGWRLPTVKELYTVVDFSRRGPSIDVSAFPSTPSDLFWSSTPLAGVPNAIWGVSFDHGESETAGTSFSYPYRCVR